MPCGHEVSAPAAGGAMIGPSPAHSTTSMNPLALQQIRSTLGARPLSVPPTGAVAVTSVCSDSRRIEPGSLFVALVGENHDGHDYLPQAAAGGAVAALV